MFSKTILALVAIIAIVACATAAPSLEGVDEFVAFAHSNDWANVEDVNQRTNFYINRAAIEAHNAQENKTYTMGVTRFSHMSAEEFNAYLTLHTSSSLSGLPVYSEEFNDENDTGIDWRTKGKVSKVKDQGQCGSCWSFSATGVVESFMMINKNDNTLLSEQNLVDCDKEDSGCQGGLMENALQYIIDHNGIASEADYPYTARDDTCKDEGLKKYGAITSFSQVKNSMKAMKSALRKGPVSVGVNASPWQNYQGGVLNKCSRYGLNHGVLLVGYEVVNGQTNWIVKNSWGPSWGENGYIRIQAGLNDCGILTDAHMPTA